MEGRKKFGKSSLKSIQQKLPAIAPMGGTDPPGKKISSALGAVQNMKTNMYFSKIVSFKWEISLNSFLKELRENFLACAKRKIENSLDCSKAAVAMAAGDDEPKSAVASEATNLSAGHRPEKRLTFVYHGVTAGGTPCSPYGVDSDD